MLLSEAIQLTKDEHWAPLRSASVMGYTAGRIGSIFEGRTLEDITKDDLLILRDQLVAEGLASSSIYHYCSVVSTIYDVAAAHNHFDPDQKPRIPYPKIPRLRKWWLTPDMQPLVIEWLEANGHRMVAYYVMWTVLTGLRVEETLRTTRGDFIGLATPKPALSVPGTKTRGAETTLPLSADAAELATRLLTFAADGREPLPSDPLFPFGYDRLWETWNKVRDAMGLADNKTATLKALRRSYARARAAKGCPLPQLQQLMRHASPATTLEYLRLTGGQFNDDELRPYI